MARRYWTILLVSDTSAPSRQLRIPRRLVRGVLGAAFLSVVVLGAVGAAVAARSTTDARLGRLARENAMLRQEVAHMRDRSAVLSDELDRLTKQDREFRLVAGLTPLSSDVLLAGVGGPGTETLNEDPLVRLDPPVGTSAFDAAGDIEAMIRRARLLETSWSEAFGTLRAEQAKLAATPSIMPTHGYLSSPFSLARMHPLLHIVRPHEGIDIAAPVGTPIRAAADGVISFAARDGDYGLMVEIDHGHGFATRYAHASRILVHVGQRVERGQEIAEVGESGLAMGPHLHYEVLVNGKPQNPVHFILTGHAIPE